MQSKWHSPSDFTRNPTAVLVVAARSGDTFPRFRDRTRLSRTKFPAHHDETTMKLKEIQRTSTFAWAPFSRTPLLATGTVAGALDASFTNDSQLEIWDLDFMNKDEGSIGGEGQKGPTASVTTHSRFVQHTSTFAHIRRQNWELGTDHEPLFLYFRFNRLAWGSGDGTRSKGVIAAGMENGELNLWDPEKIVASAE